MSKRVEISKYVCGPLIRKVIKDELKADIKKMNTVELVKKNTIPTIYVHSKGDKDVPFSMVFPLYNNDGSNKFLFPIKEENLYNIKKRYILYSQSFQEFVKENIT